MYPPNVNNLASKDACYRPQFVTYFSKTSRRIKALEGKETGVVVRGMIVKSLIFADYIGQIPADEEEAK